MKTTRIILAAGLATGLGGLAGPVSAFTFEQSGADVRLDTRLSAGAAWRVQDRRADHIGISNGGTAYSTNEDDGDLAFQYGEVVSSAFKATTELTVRRDDFGIFVRGSGIWNDRLIGYDFFNQDNYYAPPVGVPDPGVGLTSTGRPSEATFAEYNRKTDDVRDAVGSELRLLDAYFFGYVPLGDTRDLHFKIGRQVINWGESTFVLNGINSILTFDQNQEHIPGVDLAELFRPNAMIWLSTNLTDELAIEGFYQLDWRPTRINASGTFWSTNDFAGQGGTRANITFGLPPENYPSSSIPRARAQTPGSDGQFGVKLSMLVPQLNDMDLSVYAMTYNSRLPVVSGISGSVGKIPAISTTGRYFLEYPDQIQLYGMSFNTTLLGWAVQGEYSYKVDQPLQIDDVELLLAGVGLPSQLTPPGTYGQALGNKYIRGWRRHDVSQADLSTTYLFGKAPVVDWDQLLVVGEVAMDYVHDLPSESVLRYDGPGTFTPGDATTAAVVSGLTLPLFGYTVPQQTRGYATDFSWGYRLYAQATYNAVLGVLTIKPSLRFDHDVHGVTPGPLTNFVEGRRAITAMIDTLYLQNWSWALGYTNWFGGGQANQLSDRDFITASIKYTF